LKNWVRVTLMILYYSADFFRYSFADFLNDMMIFDRFLKNEQTATIRKIFQRRLNVHTGTSRTNKKTFFTKDFKNADNGKRIKIGVFNEFNTFILYKCTLVFLKQKSSPGALQTFINTTVGHVFTLQAADQF
ncbi:MAG: hypothetical protein ACK56F_21435, partial [bacterium]